MKKLLFIFLAVLIVAVGGIGALVVSKLPPKPGTVIDEAKQAGLTAEDLPGSDNDYLHDMDYGLTNDPDKVRVALEPYLPTYDGISAKDDPDAYAEAVTKAVVRGRNNWTIWTAGNDTIWDELSRLSFGNLDFLKTLSSRDDLPAKRANRWEYLGLVNEPCFKEATGPREDRYGLWLDERIESPECPADPFEDETEYPGVEVGARGKDGLPVGSYYGYASGVVGLRLFPNPEFDAKAQEKWDPDRYYTDASYFNDKDLVKPYRVGMSCAFCHIGPNPTNPPKNFDEPKWENLNSNPGAQYFWIDRIFDFDAKEPGPDGKFDTQNFIYQLFHTSRPGALDTSLVSSDQINNPRTMNAVYDLGARVELATKWGQEELDGGELNNKQLNDYVEPDGPLPADGPLNGFYEPPATVLTPRVLKDGADSVGALGALNRVYVNIGLFSQEWLLHFIPLLGGPKITPFPIATAQKNSVYWNANTLQTPDTALFFLASAKPDKLENAPGSGKYLTKNDTVLTRGKEVFAETCARCHSSKLPEKAFTDFFPNKGCVNSNYLDCWNDYWQWTKTDEFKDEMKKIALNDDFLDNNFLSTDLRIPSTLLETNLGSPLATNAIAGDIWNDFSSSSYKGLPAVGTVTVHDPFTYEPRDYEMPGGGRGYTRPPSLTSLWSTAPYLLNNSLGKFDYRGTVEGRMESFDDSIHQLLWPEDRDCYRPEDYEYEEAGYKPDCSADFVTNSGKKVPGIIDRTSDMSYLSISGGFLPDFLRPRLIGFLQKLWPGIFGDGGLRIGPIPEGTPVNLISNIDLSKKKDLIKLAPRLIKDLKSLPANATNEDARAVFGNLVEPLLNISKSPDFVVNRGHYFGTDFLPASEGETPLSDSDKNALIEFLKTL